PRSDTAGRRPATDSPAQAAALANEAVLMSRKRRPPRGFGDISVWGVLMSRFRRAGWRFGAFCTVTPRRRRGDPRFPTRRARPVPGTPSAARPNSPLRRDLHRRVIDLRHDRPRRLGVAGEVDQTLLVVGRGRAWVATRVLRERH